MKEIPRSRLRNLGECPLKPHNLMLSTAIPATVNGVVRRLHERVEKSDTRGVRDEGCGVRGAGRQSRLVSGAAGPECDNT